MLPPQYEGKLRELLKIFLSENERLNLSALRTEEACWVGNILDSLAFLDVRFAPTTKSILDIGTGGGFPLLPLAICMPGATLTGVDSTGKKIDAVKRIADAMNLRNVHVIAGRSETLGHHPRMREQFDVVTARAVAEIDVLLEYCSPFVKVGGRVVLWKSMDIAEELESSRKAQKDLKCEKVGELVYELPGDFGKRQLIIFEKKARTPATFPRAVGLPKKNPL